MEAGAGRLTGWVNLSPTQRTTGTLGHHLKHAIGQVGVRGGSESVKATIVTVFGQINRFANRVDGCGFVVEPTEAGTKHRCGLPGWVTLPYLTEASFFAAQPCAPWGSSATAVASGSRQDGRGFDDVATRIKANHRGAATVVAHLGIGYIDPAPSRSWEGSAAVWSSVPGEARVGHRLASLGNDAGGETLGKLQAQSIRSLQWAVRSAVGSRTHRAGHHEWGKQRCPANRR